MFKPASLVPALLVTLAARAALAQGPSAPEGAPPAPAPAPAPPAPPPPASPATAPAGASSAGASLTTLRLMREKGIITQAEYDSALRDIGESTGTAGAASANTLVVGKWSTTMYGFVEADNIYDSTRSFNDIAGSGQVARPVDQKGSNAGSNGRFMESVRNSRIGFRLRAPETAGGIRTSAQLEMDFLGTQLPVGSGQPYFGSEGAFFTNPTFRIRHVNLKIETPVVDVLIGQYWQLFGWQSMYHPATVEIQGVPGQIYSRTPQIRLSKSFKSDAVTFEMAVAATRPVQRDSSYPDGQAGLRLALNKWTAVQTQGSTGTQISPASLALTGYLRNVTVDELSATPKVTHSKVGAGGAADLFLPIIPGTKENKDNSLALNGEVAYGEGSADFYTGLSGGIGFPTIAGAAGAPATPFAANIDSGIVTYAGDGTLHYVRWTSYLLGLQYYFPGTEGRMFLTANYSHHASDNIASFGQPLTKVRSGEDWFDVNLFGDVTPAVRLGLEGALFDDQYADGYHAKNYRVQASAFYLF